MSNPAEELGKAFMRLQDAVIDLERNVRVMRRVLLITVATLGLALVLVVGILIVRTIW